MLTNVLMACTMAVQWEQKTEILLGVCLQVMDA